jgi:formiminotetrahydrofolate cyclodeaminase
LTEKPTVWDLTLSSFRERTAQAGQPTTGVSVAVVSATLGASLLEMVLELMAKRSTFAGDASRLTHLRVSARDASQQLMLHADADIAAYGAYTEARRTKAAATEIARCQQATIDVPLQAARASLAALDLCVQASAIVTGPMIADLATATILLEGAVRSILGCVSENLRRLPNEQAAAECLVMKQAASRLLKAVVPSPA